MFVVHGLWIPDSSDPFFPSGDFFLWVESSAGGSDRKKEKSRHPRALYEADLAGFLKDRLRVKMAPYEREPFYQPDDYRLVSLLLPTVDGQPCPSPELALFNDGSLSDDAVGLSRWRVGAFRLPDIIEDLRNIHYLASFADEGIILGNDLRFWVHFSQRLRNLLIRDQYIPALVARDSGSGRRRTKKVDVHAGWQWIGRQYEEAVEFGLAHLPTVCSSVQGGDAEPALLHDPATLLRNFLDVMLDRTVRGTPWTRTFEKRLEGTFLQDCLQGRPAALTHVDTGEWHGQWFEWRRRIGQGQEQAGFHLGFRLHDAAGDTPDEWILEYLVIAKADPSLMLSLQDYWEASDAKRKKLCKPFGPDFEKHFLIGLGIAARIYPPLWRSMESETPLGMFLRMEEAFSFLSEDAWILEDAGFRVMVPAWWTPKGRRKAKIRLRSKGKSTGSGAGVNANALSLDNLIQFDYQLTIGDQTLSEREWQQLVNSKSDLVRYRGQWMHLDREQMERMLAFWQERGKTTDAITMMELLQLTAEEDALVELDEEDLLATMRDRLRDADRLELIEPPAGLKADLRAYQQRGLSWLAYLEQNGLNGCLADDMGLGKTLQMIALLLREGKGGSIAAPTLLIAPTSVMGNWQKEIQRFAPALSCFIHHGPNRLTDADAFAEQCRQVRLVITSYALGRRDQALLKSISWRRIVLDEAQNIKNPNAAQTKAILKLQAQHRWVLTGTPVENRLQDLWSLFHFLHPGYLGRRTEFRKRFEVPIQRENDPLRMSVLKRLVEPFILRRLKTDKRIIRDLPEKVENRQYCQLSKEQASLYEAVVEDVKKQLEGTEGIQRNGLMLGTLTKLKQICNHPAQFLQDDSPFTPERSHKMERFVAMLEEVLLEGDSLLVFSQFTDVCEKIDHHLRTVFRCPTHYIHGGTSRTRRDRMIAEFQDPETPPSAFVLSLKAGGVGITLTKANHVFHFDRWWNPAVEDQATDRAFRIGQEKRVMVHKFITSGTLEERIDQMIEDKRRVAGSIVGGDESWITGLSNEKFHELIALSRDSVLE